MACTQGCNDCHCEEVKLDVPVKEVEVTLNEKLRVFNDFICYIGNATCPSLPNLMAKFGFYVWCMLKDLVKMVICLYNRTNTLRKRDNELCEKLITAKETMNSYANISNSNNFKVVDYLEEMSDFQGKQEGYLSKKAEYDKALEDYKANSSSNGYLKNPTGQSLIFLDEPNASIESITGGKTIPSQRIVSTNVSSFNNLTSGVKYSEYSTLGEGVGLIVNDTDTLVVTYTGLTKSSYRGIPIKKVRYTYKTVRTNDSNGKTFYFAFKNPTKGVFAGDTGSTTGLFEFDMTAEFLDSEGKVINLDPSDAIISYASLNRTTNSIEQVKNIPESNFMGITGSSIDYSNGTIKASSPNSFKQQGAKYEYTEWDVDGSPLEYYGASASKYVKTFRVSVEVLANPNANSSLWFVYNTNIKAKPLPKLPVKPVKPSKPELKELPQLEITCGDLSELPCGYLEG